MKKIILLMAALAINASFIYAQKQQPAAAQQLPVDNITKLITYESVVEVPNTAADILYKRALGWFNEHYPNPREVIRENDSTSFKIVGKPRFKIYNPADKSGLKTEAGLVQYTITVACKEGRYRYEISAFNWKQASYYAVERWLDTKDQYYTPAMAEYMNQVDLQAKEVIKSLKSAVLKDKPVKDRDNW